jgi:DNA-binding transcriptional ArsR family regulator
MKQSTKNYYGTKEGFIPLRRMGGLLLAEGGRSNGGTLLPSDTHVLMNICFLVSPANAIAITTKEELAKLCGMDPATVMKSVKRLYENRIVATINTKRKKKDEVYYMVTPYLISFEQEKKWYQTKRKFDSCFPTPEPYPSLCHAKPPKNYDQLFADRRAQSDSIDVDAELAERESADKQRAAERKTFLLGIQSSTVEPEMESFEEEANQPEVPSYRHKNEAEVELVNRNFEPFGFNPEEIKNESEGYRPTITHMKWESKEKYYKARDDFDKLRNKKPGNKSGN